MKSINKKNYIENKINSQIEASQIRIINRDDYEEEIPEILTKREALDLANEYETDLIEVAFNSKENSSICKLIDKDKFIYQEKKKAKEAKALQKKSELKEIKLGVDIADNDFNTKKNQARKFLEKGDRVKVSLQLRGRQRYMAVAKDNANILLLKFADELNEVGKVTEMPSWINDRAFMQLSPKK